MKRWNGWGDVKTTFPLPASAAALLSQLVGEGEPVPDATLAEIVATVPESRLPGHPLISHDAESRLGHARGQSLPDWIALRSGRIETFPDGVAYPTSDEEVRALLDMARETEAHIIPFGGGTSVVGHINPLPSEAPVLTVDLGRLDRLTNLDENSRLATFGAGVRGPDLEEQLRERGYTLGHYPQSFEYSTLGGWIATRSSGQQSYHYGRIEEMFAGGHLELPLGTLELPPLPASAAGPDLRQLILGSEGRLGIITRATIRVRQLPETEAFYAVLFHDWPSGVEATRAIRQAGVPLSMLRFSDAQETETTLALTGRDQLLTWVNRGLRLLDFGPERCLLLFGVTGAHRAASRARRQAHVLARRYGGLALGSMIGRQWRKGRFLTPYLRNTLWERGYAVDTLETALPWSSVVETAAAIKGALSEGLAEIDERVLVFAHLSHIYRDGASIYVTFLFRRSTDPDETLRRWQLLKRSATEKILANQGTISHQHGVGLDHVPYLVAEKGDAGIDWLQAVSRAADPQGIMNPGKLLPRST